MVTTLEYISAGVVSAICIKMYGHFYRNRNEKKGMNDKVHDNDGNPIPEVDIICDVTNNFGKYYVKEVVNKKHIIGIIPVYKSYNKEYINMSRFNDFMAELFVFINLRNGKLILASEDNSVNDYFQTNLENNFKESDDNSSDNGSNAENVLLASCIIVNEKVSLVVCVIDYETDLEKQLDFFLTNKKNNLYVIINNIFINNIKYNKFKNNEIVEKDYSLNKKKENHPMYTFFPFLKLLNIRKEYLKDLYLLMQIHMNNFIYFYKMLGNSQYSETYLNGYMSDNVINTKIYNSLMDIYHNLIFEAIKKDNKNINLKKMYTPNSPKCDYTQMVKLTLMKLESNQLLFYIYNIYSYIYNNLI
ncbi:conserved protein, unknown function [Hepatocystis sp. ex Piliocolobus tephrosceles]|nr:conserved protein, unknown function [Hepatocystis sp. ex Piliocolobus tephrosceles]